MHTWLSEEAGPVNAIDREVVAEMFTPTGAFLMGRRVFDLGEEPWGDDGTLGKPRFVVTHREREQLVRGPTTFTFVTDGLHSALKQAQNAAGERNVVVMGGAAIAQACLRAGLLDELHIHLIPVVFGAGTRLFDNVTGPVELVRTRVIESPRATHLRFDVSRK